jgi:hypothetical protein
LILSETEDNLIPYHNRRHSHTAIFGNQFFPSSRVFNNIPNNITDTLRRKKLFQCVTVVSMSSHIDDNFFIHDHDHLLSIRYSLVELYHFQCECLMNKQQAKYCLCREEGFLESLKIRAFRRGPTCRQNASGFRCNHLRINQ